METQDEIRRWLHRARVFEFRYQTLHRVTRVLAFVLLAFALLVFSSVRWQIWVPDPFSVLFSVGLLCVLTPLIVLLFSWRAGGLRFLADLEKKLNREGQLRTWLWLKKNQEKHSPVSALFLQRLNQDLRTLDVKTFYPARSFRWDGYAFILAAIFYALLFMPWGGGESWLKRMWNQSISTRPDLSKETLENSASQPDLSGEETSPQTKNTNSQNPGRGGDASQTGESPKTPQLAFERVPKFVPAQKLEGQSTLKEVHLYDLPVRQPGLLRSQTFSPYASHYEELKEVAEQRIQREQFEAEDAAFVRLYFQKIRP